MRAILKKWNNDGDGVFAWGAVPGPDNRKTWEAMEVGDYVAFYQSKHYTFLSKVIGKKADANFASALWGTDGGGRTWELMFFLSPPERISKSLDDIGDYLQSSPYMGFTKIPASRTSRILESYDDVGAFVTQRFLKATSTYLLLRSNSSSQWDDEDAKTYHFSRTVANYKKIAPGARFIVDRRSSEGLQLIGTGIVAGVQRVADSDGEFVASMKSIVILTHRNCCRRNSWVSLLRSPGST